MVLPTELRHLERDLLQATQAVYDAWDQDADGVDVELGEGGICQDIADAIVGVLSQAGFESSPVDNGGVGEQHVWTVVQLPSGVWSIDIPAHVYEMGSGYRWRKISGVAFRPNHIVSDRIDKDPEKYSDYIPD